MSYRSILFAFFSLTAMHGMAQGSAVPVFLSGTEGYASFRIPAIIRAPDHDLLAFCEGRVNGPADFGNVKIVMKRSSDDGRTWSRLQVVASNDTLQAGNSAPVVDMTDPAYPRGRIFLFYCTGNASERSVRAGHGVREVWYKTSTDNGHTWSRPVNITLQVHRPHQPSVNPAYDFPEDWRCYATTPGHAIQLQNGAYAGRIVVPINHSSGDAQPHFSDFSAADFYTDDHGRSFHLGKDVRAPGGNEAMAAEIGQGNVMLNIRNQRGDIRRRIVAISKDGGASWDTVYYDKRLPDPVCQGSILSFGRGHTTVAVCNDADTMQRNDLTLRISDDEGRTWGRPLVIDSSDEASQKKDYTAYSDMVELAGKRIGVLYEKNNYREIVFSVVSWGVRAALIPLPRRVHRKPGAFWLGGCRGIAVGDPALWGEGQFLQRELLRRGVRLPVIRGEGGNGGEGSGEGGTYICLQLGHVAADRLTEEAYRLDVSPGRLSIEGNTPHGVFNGMETVLQLAGHGGSVDDCSITDWPAFSWRGYMVDVGRNFESVRLLEQQIDQMGRYKLNVFHLHLTEDIAWRIAIKKFPGLTAAGTMLRDTGDYYSERDIRELMAYCSERHILFLPEIDMPGHSGAFTRALKCDMQSDSGLAIVKAILGELSATYGFRYIHIGGDEVRIRDTAFLPAVLAYLGSLGIQPVGWEPGGNLGKGCMRQLWKGYGRVKDTTHVCIDSRHLYLNHMDPLESVVTIFEREIGGVSAATPWMAGATLCLWNDRPVADEGDLLRMNPVYPAMLAFAERAWRGGGTAGWVTGVGEPGTERAAAFAEFEDRLLDHRREYFAGLPFPYVRQSSMVWDLYGPFLNGGDRGKAFAPEMRADYIEKHRPAHRVVGGTVILRHWWYPAVHGVLDSPRENTTWYASTRIWSEADTVVGCWIGFNNFSRSMAVDEPPAGAWDDRQSRIWVNGAAVMPPVWKYGGQKGDAERPLVDQGYEYRPPTRIAFRKGWNTILVKAPVGRFQGRDGQNPVKWMFTFSHAGDPVR